MSDRRRCLTCANKKDVLVPCDWLKTQKNVVLSCPHYVDEEDKENGKVTRPNYGRME